LLAVFLKCYLFYGILNRVNKINWNFSPKMYNDITIKAITGMADIRPENIKQSQFTEI
jgi:hypothetical protein